LKSRALDWYFPKRNLFHSWADFSRAIQEEFLEHNHEEILRMRLLSCKQGEDEDFSNFLARFELLADELEIPLEDVEKLRFVKNNLNLTYQEKLLMSNFESSSHLVKSCRRIQNFLKNKLFDRNNFNNIQNDQYATQLQDRNWACQNGAEKLTVGDSKLNNLYNKYENKIAKNNRYHNSYKPYNNSRRFSNFRNVYNSASENGNLFQNRSQTDKNSEHLDIQKENTFLLNQNRIQKQFQCFNCNANDHKFRNCTKPRKFFCFNCGTPNAKTFNCTVCRKNEQGESSNRV
jgi:hypothetical protein